MFNRETTLRGSILMIARYWGEHLGRSMAYARVNRVVPLWTEPLQRQQQKPSDKKTLGSLGAAGTDQE